MICCNYGHKQEDINDNPGKHERQRECGDFGVRTKRRDLRKYLINNMLR